MIVEERRMILEKNPHRVPLKPIPFFPNHALTELALALFFIGGIFVLAALSPHGLGAAADPLVTPEHIKPEWYFLWMFEILKLVPSKLVGILIVLAIFVALILVPWLDRQPSRRFADRKVAFAVLAAIIILCAILSYLTIY
ncbi:cytochrome b subunit of the bc complex [Desulfitobacterium sp. AusDCA]|uniref:cytochrome b subunit of the bc complex n=1 Tax=Desulfitobacterium sp. AusDCA TaxID=3240383 RepID=UPI003DA70713